MRRGERRGRRGNVGDTMFTSYKSRCYGRQAASLLVLILQHRHGAVAMVTSSREREGGREGETEKGSRGRKENSEASQGGEGGRRGGETRKKKVGGEGGGRGGGRERQKERDSEPDYTPPTPTSTSTPTPNSFSSRNNRNCASALRSYRSQQGDEERWRNVVGFEH